MTVIFLGLCTLSCKLSARKYTLWQFIEVYNCMHYRWKPLMNADRSKIRALIHLFAYILNGFLVPLNSTFMWAPNAHENTGEYGTTRLLSIVNETFLTQMNFTHKTYIFRTKLTVIWIHIITYGRFCITNFGYWLVHWLPFLHGDCTVSTPHGPWIIWVLTILYSSAPTAGWGTSALMTEPICCGLIFFF